jgi:hypothetical protein
MVFTVELAGRKTDYLVRFDLLVRGHLLSCNAAASDAGLAVLCGAILHRRSSQASPQTH